jgi:hypothetical protein
MDSPNYILDVQLPINQDFKSLKGEALAYIQEYTGNEWTNLNPSDPGITILDQLCFALTELGYCNDFSVSDILTKPNGELHVENQFYLPEDILTTAPVTIIDYRKYLIDGVAAVNNAIIVSAVSDVSIVNGVYRVYLLIDDAISYPKAKLEVCKAAFYYLNKSRNLGEMFLLPTQLQKVPQLISGRIDIDNGNIVNQVLLQIQNAANDYIFPKITSTGYDQLIAEGFKSNQIYNGPLMNNGWIATSDLTEKRAQLFSTELAHIIEAIPGVIAVADLRFVNTSKPTESIVVDDPDKLLSIDIGNSAAAGLDVYSKSVKLQPNTDLKLNTADGRAQQQGVSVVFGATIDTEPTLPPGKYRDINDYYSIQNTFPEIFAVGADAINSNAVDYQIAQSRQLKGYLTLFDQLLANQFSQLANVHSLFSFKNSTIATPSDQAAYYAEKDKYQREHGEYPVPYKVFSPTYYYQSLYEVPHIRPLLKNNDTFNFSLAIESEQELALKSWKDYKEDPYNPYIKGLMNFMEDENNSLNRRNDILDHLLARHGESPLIINAAIDGSVYSGNSLKDLVIFKSLYLQNLGLLSYYRHKAYDYQGANKIDATLPEVTDHYEEVILGGFTKDFIFNSSKIDHLEKLGEQDFINYSAIELKLNLLFGLKVAYKNFIADNYNNTQASDDIKLALWLIQERRGFIFLETSLLVQNTAFEVALKDNINNTYWITNASVDYNQAILIDRQLRLQPPTDIAAQIQQGNLVISGVSFTGQNTDASILSNKVWKPITGTEYSFNIKVFSGPEIDQFENNMLFYNRVELIFPSFIPQLNRLDFKNRLDLFLQNNLPVLLDYKCHFVSSDVLKSLIPAFVDWHNDIAYSDQAVPEGVVVPDSQYAGVLTSLLTEINLLDDE